MPCKMVAFLLLKDSSAMLHSVQKLKTCTYSQNSPLGVILFVGIVPLYVQFAKDPLEK